ncbi:MAG TPA: hypothetical protein VML75_28705 [Kofleriaceae bacterium]|nr:hypothetical protein [Kofleriaceae bacterium]
MSEEPFDPIAALLASKRTGAEQVERGRFRLDWKRALDKVKRFQLTDPHRYALELVQGAVAGGATSIEVSTDADDVIITHRSNALNDLELEQLFDFLFAKEGELTALKQLAIGVNAALALEPKFIHVDVGARRLRLTSHQDLEVLPLAGEPVDGVRVHVRERLSWRVVTRAVRDQTSEVRLLAEHCRFSPAAIIVNGTELPRGLAAPAMITQPFGAGAMRGVLALPVKPLPGSEIQVCMNGVHIVTTDFRAENPWLAELGVIGAIDDPALTRNASHTDVHRDARFSGLANTLAAVARTLLTTLVRDTLAGKAPATEDPLRHYHGLAARSLLRFADRHKLSDELACLLDVPDLVELAVTDRPRSSLRPVWDACARAGALNVAEKRYDVKLADLPDGVLPVLGPAWVLSEVFEGQVPQGCDELLVDLERGRDNARKREALRREPRLNATEAVVRVPFESGGIRGELGLDQGTALSILRLVDADGVGVVPDPGDGRARMLTVFMREGVPIGARWIEAGVLNGVALLESEAFAPNPAWTDLADHGHVKTVTPLLYAAVPALVAKLCDGFAELPPPEALRTLDRWSAGPHAQRRALPSWPTDSLAKAARAHVDAIMARRILAADDVPGLRSWPIFHLLDGTAVSLDQIAGKAPLAGGPVTKDRWRLVIEASWGDGAPEGRPMLNATPLQREVLTRYLGHSVTDGAPALAASRSALVMEMEAAKRRADNVARAELRRQEPALRGPNYAAGIDLEVTKGRGQMGIPALGANESWVRFLIDGLPLVQRPLQTPVPIHAVMQSASIEPDATFEQVGSSAVVDAAVALITDSLPGLIDAFVGSPAAPTQRGLELIWAWLEHCATDKRVSLSDALWDFPLMATVSGERASLRHLRDSAKANKSTVHTVDISPGRIHTDQPVVLCGAERRRVLERLLGIRAVDYSRQLARELETLERKQQPSRAPRLVEPMLLSVVLDGGELDASLEGEIGIPAGSVLQVGEGGWVEVMARRVFIERRPFDFGGMPFVAVVSSDALRANKNWTHVIRNAAWKKIEKALGLAAERLLIEGCKRAGERSRAFATPALLVAFQAACGARFRGVPERVLEPATALEEQLATTPLWESVDHRDRVTLQEIAEHWQRTGNVLVIPSGEGELAPGRLIVRGGADTSNALEQIFGGRVRDGGKFFKLDREAFERRSSAPSIDTRLVFSLEPVPIEAATDDGAVSIRGQVACTLPYPGSDAGGIPMPGTIDMTIGVDGRVLQERSIAAPVHGVARIDCRGLQVNSAWTGAASSKQLDWIDRVIRDALWESVARIASDAGALSGSAPGNSDRRVALLDALVALLPDKARPELRNTLLDLPLFRTIQRQTFTANQLAAGADPVLVVSDQLDEGNPRDGRRVIRASSTGIQALEALVGDRVVRDDERWSEELAGARRYESLLPSRPNLEGNTVSSLFFQTAHTYGMAGMLRPAADHLMQDSQDPRSRLRIHIGSRQVASHELTVNPAIEAWINDDRLTPDAAFRDVARDAVYDEVVELVKAQRDELVARAAEGWAADQTGRTRARVCQFIMDRHHDLPRQAGGRAESPAARLLAAPLWRCLTGARIETLGTGALQAAHERGALAIADADTRATAAEHGQVVVLATAADAAALRDGFGELEDYTETLVRLEARRVFLRRRALPHVELDAISSGERFLFRRDLADPGWDGEIGLPGDPGRGIDVTVLVEHRPIAVTSVPATVRAVAVVHRDGLTVTPAWDGVVEDAAFTEMIAGVRRATWDTVTELANRLPQMDRYDGPIARRVLLEALSASEPEKDRDPAFARMLQALLHAPLFEDTTGQAWSVAALRSTAVDGESIHAVSPETADTGRRLGAAPNRPVIVVADSAWVSANRLMSMARGDVTYLEAAEGQRRRAEAATRYRMPRGALVVAANDGTMLAGELGLAVPPAPGRIGIFTHGHLVQERELEERHGLVGWIDGSIATDRGFETARLTPSQHSELERLWRARLEAAARELVAHDGRRRGKRWEALRHYAQRYLLGNLDAIGSSMAQRRARLLAPLAGTRATIDAVSAAAMFQDNDGAWLGLNELVSGDDPTVIVAPDRVRRPPPLDARLIIGDEITIYLLSMLLGASAVMGLDQAAAAAEKAALSRKARAEAEAKREAQKREGAHTHTLAVLTSLLREACGSALELEALRAIKVEAMKGDELLSSTDEGVVLNRNSELWQRALDARHDGDAPVIAHLAVAVLAALPAARDPQRALGLFGALAKHAARPS